MTKQTACRALPVFFLWFFSMNQALALEMPKPQHVAGKNNKSWNFEISPDMAIPGDIATSAGVWEIKMVDGVSALVQTGKASGMSFNIVVMKNAVYENLMLTVRMQALAGEEDQGGGVAWRYRDAKNYYVARANPLENNYRVYKVLNGKREMLGSANVTIAPGWHIIRIEMSGEEIRCFFDEKAYLRVRDNALKEPGLVGVWSKADAQTAFSNLMAEEIAP